MIQTVPKILTIPRYRAHNIWISIIRMILAIFVLFVHAFPWYDFYGNYVNSFSKLLNHYIVVLFQGSDETNPAVIAFITLSGYCIHRNGVRLNHMNVKHFYIRRFFRIVPLLLVGVILGVVVFYLIGEESRIKAITGTANLYILSIIYKLTGLHAFIPFGFDSVYQGNGPLITCAVEVWLYIFYPVLLTLIKNKGEEKFWLILISISIIGAISYSIFPNLGKWWHNGSFFGFLIYWWIGVYCVNKNYKIFDKTRIIFPIYIFLSTILILYPRIFLIVELRKILFSLLVGALLRFVENKPLNKLFGRSFFESSFSLYALHTPLICIALFHNINIYLALFFILVLGWLSYRYIEKPFIKLGRSIIKPDLTHASSVDSIIMKERSRADI